MPEHKPFSRPWRRFLRFSVRGTIGIVLIIGVWLGWFVRSAPSNATRLPPSSVPGVRSCTNAT